MPLSRRQEWLFPDEISSNCVRARWPGSGFAIHEAFAQTLTGERPPVFWVQGQGCTGCSVTLLNSTHPSIADVLLKIISLEFHPTVMAAEGEGAYEHMMRVAEKFKGKFIFAVEGAVPVAHDGKCCVVAEADHHEVTMTEVTKVLAANAAAVLAVGTCAAYGGIPAGKGNETGAMGVSAFLKKEGIPAPVINIPGCPPHPDWIVGTIGLGLQALATNTLGLLVKQGLDANGRPKAFYKNVHMNWCVNNATCIGCTSPTFPDGQSPFYVN